MHNGFLKLLDVLKNQPRGWSCTVQLLECCVAYTRPWVQSPVLHKLGMAVHSSQYLRDRGGEIEVILDCITSSRPTWDHPKPPTAQEQYRGSFSLAPVISSVSPWREFFLNPRAGPSTLLDRPDWPSLMVVSSL